ncbi:class I SAM-dependent methyltransferase [Salegentibacter sp. JZCK2]|uniref:class I SAM-dependent methyltransferase n=1 Tax=Salegentibacter tibetensis TaxID=2873600 RepID=UPI001CCC8B2B|nr:class I SAM-dependent methyltransferase [Salegentibacter tibetensis]MBZ9731561.1 class I SAM-dependent methyltransferase [Salegentibacter tibetensis]
MKDFWNERYAETDYAYGKAPNEYFKEKIDEMQPGKILLPAEGEGRNAVYAATQEWEVSAIDISEKGKEKALKLANAEDVQIDYKLGELPELGYKEEQFDVIALIFAHFAREDKENYLEEFKNLLKPGGLFIFEAFSKEQIDIQKENPKSGGPKDAEMLFSKEEVQTSFKGYKFEQFEDKVTELSEGKYHQGQAAVIRFVAKKPLNK